MALRKVASVPTPERRKQKRFEVDAPIRIVAIESESGHIATSSIPGRTLNVSASGALIQIDADITTTRIWMRLDGTDQALSECHVIRRHKGLVYGVEFSSLWPAETIKQLLQSVSEPIGSL